MDSFNDNDEQENTQCSEQLNGVMVSIIKQFPVLLEKSQLPTSKEKKAQAMKRAKQIIANNSGKNLDEKQILKKISNIKVQVKKKTDKNQTGKRKVILSAWEDELYKILQGDENPTITKRPSSISAGFQRNSSSTSRSTDLAAGSSIDDELTQASVPSTMSHQSRSTCSVSSVRRAELTPLSSRSSTPQPTQSTAKTTKRKTLPGETEETLALSTPKLQRLVLLEQLRYLRAKLRRLEDNQPSPSGAAPTAATVRDNASDIRDTVSDKFPIFVENTE